MGACTHGQEGAPDPNWRCCEVFCFVHSKYLSIIIKTRLLLGALPPDPAPPLDHAGGPRPPNLLTPGKNPVGAHVYKN